jgi:hypothetical protein
MARLCDELSLEEQLVEEQLPEEEPLLLLLQAETLTTICYQGVQQQNLCQFCSNHSWNQ